MKVEWGSSVCSMPLHAAYSTSRSSTSVPRRCFWRKANTSRSRADTSQGPWTLSTRNFFSLFSTRTVTSLGSSLRTITCATSRCTKLSAESSMSFGLTRSGSTYLSRIIFSVSLTASSRVRS